MRPRAPRCLLLALATTSLSAAACDGASSELGLEAWLRVRGAQYVAGALGEDERSMTPAVTALAAPFKVPRGAPSATISGELGFEANAVLLGLRGDRGHWVVRAIGADPVFQQPTTFSAVSSLSGELPVGPATLVARGVGLDGEVGPPVTSALTVTDTVMPAGALVISLSWDTEADLDLRVVAPDTRGTPVEIWTKRRLSTAKVPPGEPKPEAAELATAGELDFDSNAQCVLDGRRQENVVWKQSAPAGAYTVRVDAASLCGEPTARWRAQVFLAGTLVKAAEGQMNDTDTRGEHGAGAGLTVLTFTL